MLKLFSSFGLAFCVALFATPAMARSGTDAKDEALLAAFDAYRAGDAIKFSKQAAKLHGSVLAPWIEYWRLSFGLEDAKPEDVAPFFQKYGDTYAAERLRSDWLKVLGKRGDWAHFDAESQLLPRADLEISCYRFSSRIAQGDEGALKEAASVWLEPRELPPGCASLSDTLASRGILSVTDVWKRTRLLFETGAITAAKSALEYLPKGERPDEGALAEAARAPKRLIDHLPKSLVRRPAKEVAVLAGIRLADLDVDAAASELVGSLASRLPEKDLKFLWGRVASEGARQHRGRALKWYALAGDTGLDDDELAWKARAGLREGDWAAVRDAIDRMSAAQRDDAAWVYWYARALSAQGDVVGAHAYYLRIAGQSDFYGLLADEELGYVATPPAVNYVPTDEEIAAASSEPGLVRALELIRLGLRSDGVREWLFTLRGWPDQKLLAAAEVARRAGVYDRAIQAADRTQHLHNFSLSYPLPFRDVFASYAKTQQLDEAWLFGLVRQESRFIADARSAAGAVGLMQLMPRTARYVARKIGWQYEPRRMAEVRTNVSLGTGYLKMVLSELGHPLLASAAYNAGPRRARSWRDARPLEGAIYVETIPFSETRDYVKKVMTNAVFYAALLGQPILPIKQRLGVIPPRDASQPVNEDLP